MFSTTLIWAWLLTGPIAWATRSRHNQRGQPLTSVVRSSSWSKSVRLKIAKNRRSESESLTTDVTDITDDWGSGNYLRYPRNLW